MWDLGVITERDDVRLRTEMAYGMFDTRGKVSDGSRKHVLLCS